MSNNITNEDYIFRGYNEEVDKGFIFNSYLKSYRSSVAMPHWKYYKEHHKQLEDILKTSTVCIAVHPNNKDDIFGYSIVEFKDDKPIVHYVYVKQTFRNFGLMTEMLKQFNINWKEDIVFTSHETPTSKALSKKYGTIMELKDE